jgi:hypothetical protein
MADHKKEAEAGQSLAVLGGTMYFAQSIWTGSPEKIAKGGLDPKKSRLTPASFHVEMPENEAMAKADRGELGFAEMPVNQVW